MPLADDRRAISWWQEYLKAYRRSGIDGYGSC